MSSNRALSQEDIQKLLRGNSKPEPWPNEEDMVRVAKAVNAEQEIVTFRNGTVFSINYKNVDRYQAVFIRPADRSKYVPCGYLSLERLRGMLKRG